MFLSYVFFLIVVIRFQSNSTYITYFFLTLLFSSCDYLYNYDFEIINETEHEVIIKTSINPVHYGLLLSDSIYRIKQGEKLVFVEQAGICGKHYVPEDYYTPEDSIPPAPKFDIFINDTLTNNLRLRSNWVYQATERTGTYTLKITPEILNETE